MTWFRTRGVTDPPQTPWAQRHPGAYLASSSWTAPQTTAAGLSACTPAGSPTFCSRVHSQWDACLLRFDQDRGVLGSGSGTISMMHFDSLGRAYALNPQEKGLSEGRGAHGSLQRAPRTQWLAEEAPGSASPCCPGQAHCGSGRRPPACPSIQTVTGEPTRSLTQSPLHRVPPPDTLLPGGLPPAPNSPLHCPLGSPS